MGILKKIKRFNQIIFFVSLLINCSNFNSKNNIKKIKKENKGVNSIFKQKALMKKVEDVSKDYIKELRKELERPIYINVLFKDNKQYYEFEIYLFDILLKDDELPFYFSTYYYKGKNVIYYYKEGLKKEKNKRIFEALKKQNLIKPNNIVLDTENTLRLNDFISWNLFICKKDVSKVKIIKKPYALDENEKPKKLCKNW